MKVVYSVSDVAPHGKPLVEDAVRSLQGVRKFIPKEDVIVFYTPPVSQKGYERLLKLAEVKVATNINAPAFRTSPQAQEGKFLDKLWLTAVDDDTVIFLDCDTIITKDPRQLIGDYDFAARKEQLYGTRNWDMRLWTELCGGNNIPCPNTGVMVFRNGLHKKLKNDLMAFAVMDIPSPAYNLNLKDEYVFGMALARQNIKIKWLGENEVSHQSYPFKLRG